MNRTTTNTFTCGRKLFIPRDSGLKFLLIAQITSYRKVERIASISLRDLYPQSKEVAYAKPQRGYRGITEFLRFCKNRICMELGILVIFEANYAFFRDLV